MRGLFYFSALNFAIFSSIHYQIIEKAELIEEIQLENCLGNSLECYPKLSEIIHLEETEIYFGVKNELAININITSISGLKRLI